MIAGQAYANFQEMYQRAMKVACIMNEIEIENRERGQAKRKFGLEDPVRRETGTSRSLNVKWGKTRENTPHSGNRREHVISVGVNTLAHAKALWVSALDVTK